MIEVRRTLLLLFITVGSAPAQVQQGDVLVGRFNRMSLYRDGSLIAFTPPRGGQTGAAFTDSGNWLAVTFGQVLVYDPSGNPLGAIPTPEVQNSPQDVAVFADGGLCITEIDLSGTGELELYDAFGAHSGSITSSFMTCPLGLTVDSRDEIWVTDGARRVVHLARDGTLLGWFSTGNQTPVDVDEAPDGSVWVALRAATFGQPGEIRHYSRDGTLLATLHLQAGDFPGVGAATDGTIWAFEDFHLTHFDAAGNLLGRFLVQAGRARIAVRTERIGVRYCASTLNSSGLPGRLHVRGSSVVGNGDVTLFAEQLPPGEFGYFLVGLGQGEFQPPGSQGTFCLAGGRIGRYVLPGQVFQGPTASLTIDLSALPTFPPAVVQPGETWAFQAWFRDQSSSNFTDAVAVGFR